jgi:ATP-dependent RNA helicase DeaD
MKQLQQTSTFSATISPEIKQIIQEHIPDYEFIKIGEAVTVDKINHSFVSVAHQDKVFNLLNIIKKHINDKILIFTQTKRNTKTISFAIEKSGYKVGMLNGNMSQGKRNAMLKSFKDGDLKIMVTTDVAARGLNMDNVGLVVNFDVPKESQSYIHRIGRTGRAGAYGKAIMLVSPEEQQLFSDIERTHRTRIKRSDHLPVVDTQGKFTTCRLDKSTDKFGK